MRGRSLPRTLAILALFSLAAPGLYAETASALPPPPGSAAAGAAKPTADETSILADAKAFNEARTGLLKALEGPDFESKLFAEADKLSPGDAASLEEYFAAKIKDAARKTRILAKAAELRLLLGQFASAATDSESSASSDAQLLRLARLWLAAGETRRAAEIAADVITSSKNSLVVDEARLVSAWASLISGSQATALALAGTLTTSDSGAIRRDALCREANFLIWAGGDAKLREAQARLLATGWPGSPEALIAAQSPSVSLMALPHWYLGGLALVPEGSSAGTGDKATPASPVDASSDAPAPKPGSGPQAGPAPNPAAKAAAASTAEGLARYQIGIFSSQTHAQSLVSELAAKGFVAKIETRRIGDQHLLAVVLFAKDNKDDLSARLKDAGYEVWLLGD